MQLGLRNSPVRSCAGLGACDWRERSVNTTHCGDGLPRGRVQATQEGCLAHSRLHLVDKLRDTVATSDKLKRKGVAGGARDVRRRSSWSPLAHPSDKVDKLLEVKLPVAIGVANTHSLSDLR
eukprot:CAMPEP_0181175948 /NCGR_PEP_ID=MMETSP1096-20121128/4359_1 /TAXON_ID=156174 ORGANISM="Chrysochromulina ericina, Strain CCMP281" /NCGR_SAMPLE_ID=MMETSP1096 /ASSEMBLY_ACC=CAM_ASM_000453 /LENGTH=121 /DNA_ID=CAMNT_0023263985 /DNA_START=342 /DNA_END=707 /DNA_ORIENTATION=-